MHLFLYLFWFCKGRSYSCQCTFLCHYDSTLVIPHWLIVSLVAPLLRNLRSSYNKSLYICMPSCFYLYETV
jgi:hypothetical protein